MRRPDLTGSGGAFAAASNSANGGPETNTTGRHTAVFRRGATQEGIEYLRKSGFNVFVSNASDPEVMREDQVGDANVIVFTTLGVALIGAEPEQINRLQSEAGTSSSPISTIKEEKVRRMISYNPAEIAQSGMQQVQIPLSYIEGRRDAFAELLVKFGFNSASAQTVKSLDVSGFDESKTTWGLQATKVANSPYSGRGVKVAVLDTGIDFEVEPNGNARFHPDFRGRSITTESFVPGVLNAKDGDGHGTHCIGTACGPRQPSNLPGYGVAFEAEIYAGKVLNDEGEGADGWIIAGIEWAINQGCRVVSMSFGAPKSPGSVFNALYEDVAQRALDSGTLLVAAAGNDSARPGSVRPVSGPADCPSILAVAAVDPAMKVARFSNGGINSSGGEVNVAAPGVDVHSSYMGAGYMRLQGTSMATPHVAGIAALFAEANPTATATELKDMLINAAQHLSLGARDVGKGLVQAPRNGQPDVQTRDKTVGTKRPQPDVGMRIQQTSPITIGGGGSVGLDFDKAHYKQTGSGVFVSPQDKLTTCQVIHQSGKLLRNFHDEIDGNQCKIVVSCQNTQLGDSEIAIAGASSGPLGVRFTETAFPPGTGTRPPHYSATGKVTSIRVENVLTGVTSTYTPPDDWRGTILINN